MPADIRVIDSYNLKVDNASLTGKRVHVRVRVRVPRVMAPACSMEHRNRHLAQKGPRKEEGSRASGGQGAVPTPCVLCADHMW